MNFLFEHDDLLNKYNTIWDKVSTDIKKKLIANLSAIKNILKPKKISCVDETTDFHDKELPSAGSNRTCLGVITNNSSLKKDENYYPQYFLKKCKYIEKKKK